MKRFAVSTMWSKQTPTRTTRHHFLDLVYAESKGDAFLEVFERREEEINDPGFRFNHKIILEIDETLDSE